MATERSFTEGLTSLEQVDEVRYLTADKNTATYRAIVAFLYDRYEASEMGWVWPAEIVAFIRQRDLSLGTYDEGFCVQHLGQLERWHVVTSEHDLENFRTLQEFDRQARRYQITERGRLVEEFVRQLESQDPTRGSLEVGRIRRLREALVALDALLKQHGSGWGATALADLEALWAAAEDARRDIRAEALRYMSQLDDERLDDLTDVESFAVYKGLLRTYVGEFHEALQKFRSFSRSLFDEWKRTGLTERLVLALVEVERNRKVDRRDAATLAELFRGHLAALIGFSAPDGTAEILEKKTLGRLLALISRIERIVLERRANPHRPQDLENLALAFRRAPSDDFAHSLAGVAFSFGVPRHQYRYSLAEADLNPHESVWRQEPWRVELRAATRGNREFQAVSAVTDRSAERALLRQQRALEGAQEKRFWDELFEAGIVNVARLELRDHAALNRVWSIVRACLRDPAARLRLEDGSTIRLRFPAENEIGEMRCPGGVLHVPGFLLERDFTDG